MKGSEHRSLRIQLAVVHPKASLDEIRLVLAHPGDEGWTAGDPWTCGPGDKHIKQARFSQWALSEQSDSLDEMDDALLRLRARMAPIEARLGQLPTGSSVCLRVFLSHDLDVFGLGWDADTIRWLASLDAYIDVSIAFNQAEEPLSNPQ